MVTPEQVARAAQSCAEYDEALDAIVAVARTSLAEHGPIHARAEMLLSMLMAAAMPHGIGKVTGIAASAILRVAQAEEIEAATGGEQP